VLATTIATHYTYRGKARLSWSGWVS